MKEDRISVCARKAKAMGLSYGKYMALFSKTAEEPTLPHCQNCGKQIHRKISRCRYCCDACRITARNRRKSANRRLRMVEKLRSGNREGA